MLSKHINPIYTELHHNMAMDIIDATFRPILSLGPWMNLTYIPSKQTSPIDIKLLHDNTLVKRARSKQQRAINLSKRQQREGYKQGEII